MRSIICICCITIAIKVFEFLIVKSTNVKILDRSIYLFLIIKKKSIILEKERYNAEIFYLWLSERFLVFLSISNGNVQRAIER